MKLDEFQRILGAISKVCDGEICDEKRKRMILNGVIKLWDEYQALNEDYLVQNKNALW